MVKLHVLLYGFEVLVFEEDSSSGVVALEAGHVEDVIFEYEESLACFLSVVFDLFVVFEFVVYLFSFGCHQLYYKAIQICRSKLLYLHSNGKITENQQAFDCKCKLIGKSSIYRLFYVQL
jgi:hypothetical protein